MSSSQLYYVGKQLALIDI